MPLFRVRDKGFVTLFQGTHLHVGVSQSQAEELAAADPHTYEPLWRQGRFFMGLRVDLSRVSAGRVRELNEMGWRHKLPRASPRSTPGSNSPKTGCVAAGAPWGQR